MNMLDIFKEQEKRYNQLMKIFQPGNTLLEQLQKENISQRVLQQYQQQQKLIESFIKLSPINNSTTPLINDFLNKIELHFITPLPSQKPNFKINIDDKTKTLFDVTLTDGKNGEILYTTRSDNKNSTN